ncbi:Protease 4 [Candidatus Entotheonellaceae bacterium PAL068K]
MKRIKKRWIILALIVVVIIGVVVAGREPNIAAGSFLVLKIGGDYTESQPVGLVGRLVGFRKRVFVDLLLELQKATADERLQGVIIKVTPMTLDFAKLQELRDAIGRLRQSDKRVIAWVTGEDNSGNRAYYLASVADEVYFAANTILPLTGLRATYVFLGGVWGHLEVEMQVEQIKEYKTFGDFLVRQSMSEAHREMANALLDDMHEQFVAGIAAARRLSPAAVQASIDAPTLTPEDYVQAGLIDGIQYFGELLDRLEATPDQTVSPATYRRVKPTSVGLMRGPKVAVVYGVGGVTAEQSGWRGTGEVMEVETMVKAFKQAAGDDSIKAIVFRIESPGGSVLASDLIWEAVIGARQAKPVVVSMSGVAASGGYYIAAGATKIVAQPATLTGSIGIVFSLPNVRGLLEKVGITTETLGRGQYARLFDPSHNWSPDERQQVKRLLTTLYQTFTRKVADGRGMSLEEVERLSRGRVWTGRQAEARGLVDQLGGLQTAVQLAQEAAGIPAAATVKLVFYPTPKRLPQTLLEQFGRQAAIPRSLRQFVPYIMPFATQQHRPLFAMPMLVHIR